MENLGNSASDWHWRFAFWGHFGAEKIEFEVCRSNFKNLEKWKILNYFLAGYFNVETQSPIKKPFLLKYFLPKTSSDKRKKDLKCKGYLKIKISIIQKIGKLSFFNIFEIWSTNFKLNFLSSQMAKMQNFSVYQMQNFLNFPKMVLLFIITLFF